MKARYPEGLNWEEKSVFQQKAASYSLIKGTLFKIGADDQLKWCLEVKDWKKVMKALHSGPSNGHFVAITTVNRIRTFRYKVAVFNMQREGVCWELWPMRENGSSIFPEPLATNSNHSSRTIWKTGNRFIGPIALISAGQKRYIILATDYATKWVETRATRNNTAWTASSFLFTEILMRFLHPLELVNDRGVHFLNDLIHDIALRYLIMHRKTTPYNPRANGLTKRVNGIIEKSLNKMVSEHKTD